MEHEDMAARLARIRDRRGYLLPHHGLMAVSMPGMLDAYDDLYSSIAFEPHALSRHNHEFVWLAVLITQHEVLGTHHIARFHEAGGTDAELADVLSIAAVAGGGHLYRFVDQHWMPHLPGLDPRASYLEAFANACGDTPAKLAHLAGAAIHACRADWELLKWQICAAYEAGVDENALAEALSLMMFPGSVPHFVDAAGIWRELILAGEVSASPAFRAWAEVTGQGGYDEAVGISSEEA
jgi:alkylhydroperoxidase/carboxymuconolactone decarboxylase family protein YurZ